MTTLCTCLYQLHLRKPVSMKKTQHSRKSEAQNLCSKCPPVYTVQSQLQRSDVISAIISTVVFDRKDCSTQTWTWVHFLLSNPTQPNPVANGPNPTQPNPRNKPAEQPNPTQTTKEDRSHNRHT